MANSSRAAAPLSPLQRYFEVSLFLLVATGVFAVISTGKLDWVSTLVPPAALAIKAVRLWHGRGPELSTRTATALVLAYMVFFPVDLWVISRGMAAGAPNPAMYAGLLAAIHLLLFAALVRLFSARVIRDYIFLATLAFAAMLASAVLTVDTTFLISLAIFLVLAVSTFVGLEIRRSAEGAASPPLEPGSAAARRLHRALGLTSLLVAVSALVLGGAIFFLIPRFTAGYLSALNLQPSLISGFTDDVTLGQIGEIKKSGAVVMRIRVASDPGRAAGVRWRGIALTNFDGKRWYTPPQDSEVVTPTPDGEYRFNPTLLSPGDAFPLRYTVLMEPIASDAIFVAARALMVRGRFGQIARHPGRGVVRSYLLLDSTGSLFNPFHNESMTRYEALSAVPAVPPAELRSAAADYSEEIRKTYLQLPPLDPRIPELARQITAGVRSPYDKAERIELYLRTRYAYTLDLAGPPTSDPLAYFLFVRRAGHCEYFASAMTVMLRVLGVPARYVNGFLPGQYNDVGGDYIVRASDAHSWVEAYFPPYGWIPFDPTPPGPEKPPGWFARLGLYWDWFQFTWNEWVINYDFSHQVTLTQNLERSSRRWSERLRRLYQSGRRRAINIMIRAELRAERSHAVLPALLALLVALLLVLRGPQIGRFFGGRWSLVKHRRGRLTPELALLEYRQMLRLLERRGWRKSPSQTPLEFVAAISSPELSAPVAQLTELYQSARFGSRPADARRMASLLAAIKFLLRSARR